MLKQYSLCFRQKKILWYSYGLQKIIQQIQKWSSFALGKIREHCYGQRPIPGPKAFSLCQTKADTWAAAGEWPGLGHLGMWAEIGWSNENVFDCVDHNKLWKSLRRWECQTILPASWETCMHVKQQARTGHGTTDCFQIGKGVRQSCILSPCLFNLH